MRAQTTLDFAVGMSVFMAVVLFIFLFVPGILEPFTVGAQDETVTTNRVADSLVQGQLGSPREPNVLRTQCTADFFADANPDPSSSVSACGESGDNMTDFLGIQGRQNVNVTVVGNVSAADTESDVLCLHDPDSDSTYEEINEKDDGSCTQELTAGGQPPRNNDDAVTARRVAHLQGEDVTVIVEMW